LTFDAEKGSNQTLVRTPYLPKTEKEHPPEKAHGIFGAFETEYPEIVFKIRFKPVNIEFVEDFFLENTTLEDRYAITMLNKQLAQRKLRLDIYIPASQIKVFYDALDRAVAGRINASVEEYGIPLLRVSKELGLTKTQIMRILKTRKLIREPQQGKDGYE